jgi:rod shape-determining protein MreC
MATVSSKKPVWITLSAALLVHSLLISIQTSHRIDTSVFRTWILDSLAPMEKLVDRTLHGTGSILDRYLALIGVHDENQRLRAEVDALTMQIAKEHEDIVEAQRLRQFVGLDDSRLGKPIVARVIGRDPTQSRQSITIDKGRVHGVEPDAAVMTPQGIAGRVVYTSNYSAVVQLIVDSQSGVGILVLPNRRLGIIKGNGSWELDLDYIDDDTDLKIGDLLITSGDDRIYPKGLPVGTIASIAPPHHALFKTVRIKPSADLGRLEEVLCIIDNPRSSQTDAADRSPNGPMP